MTESRIASPPDADDAWLSTVAADIGLLDRTSTAERVADLLRRRITEGDLPPGTRLSEESLVTALRVSRNTLREAFRLLAHEGLLVHRLHRGVFVPELTEADVVDLYRLRRTVECDVVRSLPALDAEQFDVLYATVEEAEAAATDGRWSAVGTANMRFHQHLVALAGSRRVDDVTQRILAELRLVFHVVDTPQRLYEPYITRNRELADLLAAGERERAADALRRYLQDSEAQLLTAHRARRPGGAR